MKKFKFKIDDNFISNNLKKVVFIGFPLVLVLMNTKLNFAALGLLGLIIIYLNLFFLIVAVFGINLLVEQFVRTLKNQDYKSIWFLLAIFGPFIILGLLGFGTVGSLFGFIAFYCFIGVLAIAIRPFLKKKDKLPPIWALMIIPLVFWVSAKIALNDFYNPVFMIGFKDGKVVNSSGYHNAFLLFIVGLLLGVLTVTKTVYKELKSKKNKLSYKIGSLLIYVFGVFIFGIGIYEYTRLLFAPVNSIQLTITNHRLENKRAPRASFYKNYYLVGQDNQGKEYRFQVSRSTYHQVGKMSKVEAYLKNDSQLSKLRIVKNTNDFPEKRETGFFGSLYQGLEKWRQELK